MKRLLSALILVMIIPTMLFGGCAFVKSRTAVIYKVNGDIFEKKKVEVKEMTCEALLEEMKKEFVIRDDVVINSYTSEEDGKADLVLDFNGKFADYIKAQTEQKQKLTVQAVVNTFLRNLELDTMIFTVDGDPFKTKNYDFSKSLYSFEIGAVLPNGYMEAEEETEAGDEKDSEDKTDKKDTETTTMPEAVEVAVYNPPKRPDNKKYVAMTFDDGPHNKYTRLLVDKLKEYDAHATFFVVGNRMNGISGDAIRYAHENGNEIAVHGYTHDYYYDSCSDERYREELQKTEDVIIKYTGEKPTLMRPIGGSITDERTRTSGYGVILWNNDSNDWRYKGAGKKNVDTIVNNVMKSIGDGRIILMHEIYENSYQAFCLIMEKLDEMGYKVVTVSELLGEENIKAGIKYRGY